MVRLLKCPYHDTTESLKTNLTKWGKPISREGLANSGFPLFRLELYCSQCSNNRVRVWHFGDYNDALNRVQVKWNLHVLESRHGGIEIP